MREGERKSYQKQERKPGVREHKERQRTNLQSKPRWKFIAVTLGSLEIIKEYGIHLKNYCFKLEIDGDVCWTKDIETRNNGNKLI